ncbi:uncharacterized protein [Dermacentor andersoni]|uniref:uncharacterized protein isoform X1 n=1 Tax=Dermacentor andersoni TaxID=34620 RepID=UPI003B3B978B
MRRRRRPCARTARITGHGLRGPAFEPPEAPMCGQSAPVTALLDEGSAAPEDCLVSRCHRGALTGKERLQDRHHGRLASDRGGRRTDDQVPHVADFHQRNRQPQRIHEDPRRHFARDHLNRPDPGALHSARDDHPAAAHQCHNVRHTLHAALAGLRSFHDGKK